jgi:hypothetical protein
LVTLWGISIDTGVFRFLEIVSAADSLVAKRLPMSDMPMSDIEAAAKALTEEALNLGCCGALIL